MSDELIMYVVVPVIILVVTFPFRNKLKKL
jgi:hypothetical protein